VRHLPEMQAALQALPLRQVHLRRHGPQVGHDQRGEEDQVSDLLKLHHAGRKVFGQIMNVLCGGQFSPKD
jgi:hypothetical protein